MNGEYWVNKEELKSFYDEIEDLFLYKRSLVENYLMRYDNEGDIEVIDYLLTNKIISMIK